MAAPRLWHLPPPIHQSIRRISIGWGGSKSRRRRILARSSRLNRRRRRRAVDSLPPTTTIQTTKFSPARFLNPWNDLSRILPTEDILYDRVESTSRTFGIVAALMGSLSAALLTMNTYDGYDTGRVEMKRLRTDNRRRLEDGRVTILPRREEDSRDNSSSATNIRRRDTLGFIEHVTFTHHVSGTSLLVSWGLEEDQLEDFYTACCAGSFYSGVLTTVISSVLNAWMAATPVGAIRNFVRVHSWFIVSMPALLGLSTTLAGTALFIGIDREHGTPVSYIGLGGSVFGSAVLGLVTGRGWMCTYRSVTKAVLKRGERQMS